MAAVTSWPLWWPFLLAAASAVAVWGGWRGRALVAVAALAVGLNDGVVVNIAKELIGRPRPHEALDGVRMVDLARAHPRVLALGMPLQVRYSEAPETVPRGRSFPSGHASNSFALAAVCAFFWRRWGWLVFIPAALVAWSRIYVGSHWPSDVAVSIFLGAGIGFVTAVLCELAWRRWHSALPWPAARARPSLLAP